MVHKISLIFIVSARLIVKLRSDGFNTPLTIFVSQQQLSHTHPQMRKSSSLNHDSSTHVTASMLCLLMMILYITVNLCFMYRFFWQCVSNSHLTPTAAHDENVAESLFYALWLFSSSIKLPKGRWPFVMFKNNLARGAAHTRHKATACGCAATGAVGRRNREQA